MDIKEATAKAASLWAQGLGLRAIGREVGYSHESVRGMLRGAGIATDNKRQVASPKVLYCRVCGAVVMPGKRVYCEEHAAVHKHNPYAVASPQSKLKHTLNVKMWREAHPDRWKEIQRNQKRKQKLNKQGGK